MIFNSSNFGYQKNKNYIHHLSNNNNNISHQNNSNRTSSSCYLYNSNIYVYSNLIYLFISLIIVASCIPISISHENNNNHNIQYRCVHHEMAQYRNLQITQQQQNINNYENNDNDNDQDVQQQQQQTTNSKILTNSKLQQTDINININIGINNDTSDGSTTTTTITTDANINNMKKQQVEDERLAWNPIRITLFTDNLLDDNDLEFSCKSPNQTIRILNNGKLYETTCNEDDVLTPEKRIYLHHLLYEAVDFFQSTLSMVKPRKDPIRLNLPSCYLNGYGGIMVPLTFSTKGVKNSDLVLLVTSRPVSHKDVLAFSLDCMRDGRTTVAQLNFNPSAINIKPQFYEQQRSVALHEMTHVLGLSFDVISSLRMFKEGYKRGANNQLVKSISVVTPRVQQFVREHFGCGDLEGAELEDGGGAGTSGSHWEKRIFMNEYMTGTASYQPIISNLTLSFFEDTGFYRVNYSQANQLVWGYQQGCPFVNESCDHWKDKRFYCGNQPSNIRSCTFDRMAIGNCNSNKSVPPQFDYQNNGLGGGELPDYCPFIEGFDDNYCSEYRELSVADYGELRVDNSRCFESTLTKGLGYTLENRSSSSPLIERPACYPISCLSEDHLKIQVASVWYDCPYGESIKVEGFLGRVTCPSGPELCIAKKNYNNYTQTEWPVFYSIYPSSGAPGSLVTIQGRNFHGDTKVVIVEPTKTIKKIGSEMLIVELAPNDVIMSSKLFQPSSKYLLIQETTDISELPVNVVIINNETGRNGVGLKAFTLKNYDPTMFGKQWLSKNWYIIFVVSAMAFIVLFISILMCYKRYRLNRVTPSDEDDVDREHVEHGGYHPNSSRNNDGVDELKDFKEQYPTSALTSTQLPPEYPHPSAPEQSNNINNPNLGIDDH